MWRAQSDAAEAESAATVTPTDLEVAESGVDVVHAADSERDRLREAAADLGGPSPLLHFRGGRDAAVDVTTAHPGSLPQFITGRSTLLSNLFRDEVALRTARLAAEQITAKNVELRTVRAIDAVRLAVGLASWTTAGEEFTAPVLLRPLGIRRHHADYELKLHGGFAVNPELVRALREQHGIELNGAELAALAHADGVFKPQPVIDRLRAVTRDIETFTVRPRLIVSTFADVGRAMATDLTELDHPVIDALSGHDDALTSLRGDRGVPDTTHPDERAPASDTLLLDADDEQERVLARIADGQSIVVHTLPGTGGTQTIINAVGSFVRAGKSVLVVSPRRSTLDGIRHRLSTVGLDALAVSPSSLRRDLIRAIGRNEKAVQPSVADIDEALVRLRTVLRDYRRALVREHRTLRVSALDAARRLTKLASLANPPSTSARLGLSALEKLAGDRTDAARTLTLAARLGEFRVGPDESPWYGVSFTSTEEARAAHELAGRLQADDVPALLERGYELISQTRMRPFSTVDELGEYLRLLHGIRDSLDRFSPTVFERPLADLIKAHAPRRESANLSGPARRRLKKLAKEYVRPGVHVGDMHKALVRIQHQRTQWQHLVDVGTVPEIPIGLAEVQTLWDRVESDLETLDSALGRGSRLAAMPVERLVRTLGGLAAQSEVFDNIVERAELRTKLARLGLEPLLNELAVRHVDEGRVAEELEFAWWQLALEHLLKTDRSLLGANTSIVDKLERDFRLVDEAHASASGALLAWQLAAQWKIGIVDEPDEAAKLRRALTRGEIETRGLLAEAPTLARTLAPGLDRLALRGPRPAARRRLRRRDRRGRRRHRRRRGGAVDPSRPADRRHRRPGHAEADAVRRAAGDRGRRGPGIRRREPVREPGGDPARRDAHAKLSRRRRGPGGARERRLLRRRDRLAPVGRLLSRARQPRRGLRRGLVRHARPRERSRREPRSRGGARRLPRARARREPTGRVADGRQREPHARRQGPLRDQRGLRRAQRRRRLRGARDERAACGGHARRRRSPRAATA